MEAKRQICLSKQPERQRKEKADTQFCVALFFVLFFSTTVLYLKCRSLCTKIQLCLPQHPKENKTEQKKGTNSGGGEGKKKQNTKQQELTCREVQTRRRQRALSHHQSSGSTCVSHRNFSFRVLKHNRRHSKHLGKTLQEVSVSLKNIFLPLL